MEASSFLAVAEAAARGAGEHLMAGFGSPVAFRHKGHRDFMTALDLEAERLISKTILASFPDHSILGEETGESPGDAPYRWIVDPLSSTRNFVHGVPHWAVCIAVEKDRRAIASVVFDPFAHEMYSAASEAGSRLNGQRLAVSGVSELGAAMMCAGIKVDGSTSEHSIADGLGYFSRLARLADLRSFGSAGLHMGFVASGRFDAFVYNSPDFFATTAGALLVREAGGVVTDFDGAEWTLDSRSIAASNGHIHDELLSVLRGGPAR